MCCPFTSALSYRPLSTYFARQRRYPGTPQAMARWLCVLHARCLLHLAHRPLSRSRPCTIYVPSSEAAAVATAASAHMEGFLVVDQGEAVVCVQVQILPPVSSNGTRSGVAIRDGIQASILGPSQAFSSLKGPAVLPCRHSVTVSVSAA